MTSQQQPSPRREEVMWGVYQWGRLWYVELTRKAAIQAAMNSSGETWSLTRKYFSVCNVKVSPL